MSFFSKWFKEEDFEKKAGELLVQKEWKEAIKWYQKAINKNPQSFYAHQNCAHAYLHLGEWQQASEKYSQAITLDPNVATSHQNLASVCVELKQYDKAIASYQKSLELDESLFAAKKGLANTYLLDQQYEQAAEVYDSIVLVEPSAENFSYQASAWHKIQNFKAAATAYQKALDHGAEREAIQAHLDQCLSQTDELQTMVTKYQQSLSSQPETLQYYLSYLNELIPQAKCEAIESLCVFAFDYMPKLDENACSEHYAQSAQFFDLALFTALGHSNASMFEQAIALAQADYYQRDCVLRIKGYVAEFEKDYEQAIDFYLSSILMNPQHLLLYLSLARVLLKSKRPDEAQLTLQQAIELQVATSDQIALWQDEYDKRSFV